MSCDHIPSHHHPSHPSSSLKWSTWGDVVKGAYDKPTYESQLARRVCVPLVVALIAAVVLVVLSPPFVCTPASEHELPRVSFRRLACWAAIAAVSTVVLVQSNVFRPKSEHGC